MRQDLLTELKKNRLSRACLIWLLALGFVASVFSIPGNAQVPLPPTSSTVATTPDLTTPRATEGADASPIGSSSVRVSPAILDYSLEPGTAFSTSVRVANLTSSPIAIQATARDFTPDGKVDPAYKSAYDASPWFTLPVSDFLLLPQQDREVEIKISVPKNAEPGGHYATVFFQSFAPEQSQSDAVTTINARLGVLTLLTVKGAIKESAQIVGPVQVDSIQTEAGPTSFFVTLKNDGNVHLIPTGKVIVRDALGRRVAVVPLSLGILLPGVERRYEAVWEHGVRFGAYRAEAEITFQGKKDSFKSSSSRLWLFPLVIVLPAVFIVVAVVLVIVIRRHRRRRRGRARAKAFAHLHREEIAEKAKLKESKETSEVSEEIDETDETPSPDDPKLSE